MAVPSDKDTTNNAISAFELDNIDNPSSPLPFANTADPDAPSTFPQPSPAQDSTAQPLTLAQPVQAQPPTTAIINNTPRSPLKRRRPSTTEDSPAHSADRQSRKRHRATEETTARQEMRHETSHEHRGRHSTNGSSQNGSSPQTNGTTNGYHDDIDEKPELTQSENFYGHNREEITRILLQSLSDLGYRDAAKQLSKESGYQLEVPSVAAFRNAVLSGRWEEAEALLFGSDLNGAPRLDNGQAWQRSRAATNGYDKHGLPLAEGADTISLRFLLRQQRYLELLEARDLGAALHVLRNELTPLKRDIPRLHALSS